jgi:aryl-alcohol dehydrogenase
MSWPFAEWLARELGATHTINHTGRNDVVEELRTITGEGVRFSLETSAQPAVFRAAMEALPAGTCVFLGSVRSGTEVQVQRRVPRPPTPGHNS